MHERMNSLQPVASEPKGLAELAARVKIPFASSLNDLPFSAAFLSAIPIHYAREQAVMGFAAEEDEVIVATSEVSDYSKFDLIRRLLRRKVQPVLSPADILQRAINEAYQSRSGEAQQVLSGLGKRDVLRELETLSPHEDLLDGAARAPIIKLVNLILFEAVKAFASDVHIQPTETNLAVRTRIDGVLYNSFELPKAIQEETISRVKVMGKMNIAEKRLPQDGRATVEVGDRIIDLRIASLPTSYGERIVIRLLDKSARLYKLPELGMPALTLRDFRKLIGAEHGLLLVTGPTGSGKSTTLYAALQELDCVQHNILTLEDPIEYQLEGISQTQVNEKKGMTFAAGLRNILRQDPDIIMVGEIRDRETATMAIQSAQTGHLVFSTLHTNDAASAVTRLLDLGIEPYLVASSVIGVLAQRLVRRICKHCKSAFVVEETDRQWLETEDQAPITSNVAYGSGCPQCRSTGFRGRIGIFELLIITDLLREQISRRAPANLVKQAALREGMRTLRHDGVMKILSGITTIAEVEQATMQDSDFQLSGNSAPIKRLEAS